MTNGRAAVFANEFNRYRAMPGKPAAVECVRAGCAALRDLILSEEDESKLSETDQDIYTEIFGEH